MARRRGQRFTMKSGRKDTTVDLLTWRHYTSSPCRYKRNLPANRPPGRSLPGPVRPGAAAGATNIPGTGVGTWTQSCSNNYSTISELSRERLFREITYFVSSVHRPLKTVQMPGGTRRVGYPPQVGPGVLQVQVRRSERPSAPTPQMGRAGRPAPDSFTNDQTNQERAGRSKRSRCQAVRAGPSEAYFRYAAASTQADQRRRWAVFSCLPRAVRRARLDG